MLLLLAGLLLQGGCAWQGEFELSERESIAIVGNGLADRMQHDGWLETLLHLAWPDRDLTIRNLGFTGDRVLYRPRAHDGFGTPEEHLERVGATLIFAFFGYNESFDDEPERFSADLSRWIDRTREERFDGERHPRIVLFSPIAHEDLQRPELPDGSENNRRLAAYTGAMHEVARNKGVAFVDLYDISQRLYRLSERPLTINGIHLTPEGNRMLAQAIVSRLAGFLPRFSEERIASVREAVLDKNRHWFNRYRATGGNDIWGSRSVIQGNRETLERELQMLDVMTSNRDEAIRAAVRGEPYRVDDSNIPPPVKVETTLPDADRVRFLDGGEAITKMETAEGLRVDLFASEEEFQKLVNPVQLQIDARGRLWAALWATYPKWEPPGPMHDRLAILEDRNGNGRADRLKTFAKVHNPTGFEFWNGGVVVVSAPNILFLKDTTGDDRADLRIKLIGGIDSADTHHSANNVIFGPDGWIYYQSGVFLLSNIETPHGPPLESDMSGLYRFNPRTFEVEFVVENNLNPHGISFDRWGNSYITDATTGRAYYLVATEQGFEKRRLLDHTVRPVPGNHLLSSGHLPEEFENNFLIFNVIGFQGVKRYRLDYAQEGSIRGEEIGDLIRSDDPNFRPTDGAVGPDGAFYLSDWHNPVIGHLQHNLRDPMRDHSHGRIYRISAPEHPLQEPVAIHGEPVEALLELLLHPVDGVRHRVRVELSGRPAPEVIEAAGRWMERFDHREPEGAHALLEALWLHQQFQVRNRNLSARLLEAPVARVRSAAERVELQWNREERQAREKPPHVVFVTGDEEYRSEESMPMLARILASRYGFRVSVLYALTDGVIDPNRSDNIEGLELLDEADMMVLYTRFRNLPEEQLEPILRFAESGRPMAGFRTATHAFRYGEGHPLSHMDSEWPRQVFGLPWISHHGAENSTDVSVAEGLGKHPVLRGVEPFHARSWLYHADPLHERSLPLLIGRAVRGAEPGGEHFSEPHPVAWTHRYRGDEGESRVFFTTLGHPRDFFEPSMRRLSLQGIFWALGLEEEIPQEGLNVDLVGEYDPNPSGFGERFKPGVRPEDIPLR